MANRRPQNQFQENVTLSWDHASTAGTLAQCLLVARGKKFRVDRVEYVNQTGLAVDTSNYFVVALKNGSTVIATISTHDTAVVAATPLNVPLSATDADLVAAAADLLTVSLTKTGTQTMPAGRFIVHGRYL